MRAILLLVFLAFVYFLSGPPMLNGTKSSIEKNAARLQEFTAETNQKVAGFPEKLTGMDAVSLTLRSEISQFQQLAGTNQIDIASGMAARIASELRLLQSMAVYPDPVNGEIKDVERYFSGLARIRSSLDTAISLYGTSKSVWFIYSGSFPEYSALSPTQEMVSMPTSIPPTIGPTLVPTNTFQPGVPTLPAVIMPTPQPGVVGPAGVLIPNVHTFGQFSIFFGVLCVLAVFLGILAQAAMRPNGGVGFGCFMLIWDIVAIGGGTWMLANSWGRYTGNVAWGNIIGVIFAVIGLVFAVWIQYNLLNISFFFGEKHSRESWMHN
jgi:hypothetical protein